MNDEIIIRFLLAALWGGLVGMEREYRSKSAGFRTMIMISIGSCCFTILSMFIGEGSNPDRIASNIVTGIGFLGAGVIFKGDNRVNGITTAATIWAVAAVGMAIGAGKYFMAGYASILILIVLAILPMVETMIDNLSQIKEYKVQCTYSATAATEIEKLFRHYKLRHRLGSQVKENSLLTIEWSAQGHKKNHRAFAQAMLNKEDIKRFEF